MLRGLFGASPFVWSDVAALHGVGVDNIAAAFACLANGGKSFDEPLADPFARHLDESKGRDFGHLMTGAIAAQALDESAKNQLAIGFQHHVDEIDNDDSADVAQPKLAHDLLRGFEIVASDRFFESPSGTCEFAGVDVNDGHRLRAINDERSARRQPDLSVESLGQLFVHTVRREYVGRVSPVFEALRQLRRQFRDVLGNRLPRSSALYFEGLEILVENVSNHPDSKFRLPFEEHRSRFRVLRLRLDLFPGFGEAFDVGPQLLFGRTLGGGPDDHAMLGRNDFTQQTLESLALPVGKLAGNSRHRTGRNENEVATGKCDLGRQASAFVTYRILRHLDNHRVPRFQRLLNASGFAFQPGGLPVDLAGVKNGVASFADVDEGSLHRGKDVLNPSEVDISDHGHLGMPSDIVFDENVVLENRDLIEPVLFANEHLAFDRLAPRQVLRFRDGVSAPAGLAPLTAALSLGFEPGRSLGNADFIGCGFG